MEGAVMATTGQIVMAVIEALARCFHGYEENRYKKDNESDPDQEKW